MDHRVVGEVEPVLDPQRVLEHVGGVEHHRAPAAEPPLAVLALVAVPVLHRHDDPQVAHLVLRPAVHDPGGVVVVDQVDDVVADDVERRAVRAQDRVEPLRERLAPDAAVAGLHVVHEQRDHGGHVAAVERERVPRRELADLLVGLEPRESVGNVPASMVSSMRVSLLRLALARATAGGSARGNDLTQGRQRHLAHGRRRR